MRKEQPLYALIICAVIFFVLISFSPREKKTLSTSSPQEITCDYKPKGDIISSHAPFPKHFFQLWVDENVPEKWKGAQQKCLHLNQGYNYTLWTDEALEQFIATHYSWFLDVYTNYPYPIQRVDAARYFLLYHYGGIYIDLDIACESSFDDILRDIQKEQGDVSAILPLTDPEGTTNSIMLARPKCQFMKYLMHQLLVTQGNYIVPYYTVMSTTGSLFTWKSYLKYPCKNQIHLIPKELHREVYFSDLHGGSWHTWDGKIIYKVYKYRFLIYVILFICTVSLCVWIVLRKKGKCYFKKASHKMLT